MIITYYYNLFIYLIFFLSYAIKLMNLVSFIKKKKKIPNKAITNQVGLFKEHCRHKFRTDESHSHEIV